jgi:hypothetical protein
LHSIIIVVIGKTALFWAIASLRQFCQIASGFHFFWFRNNILLHALYPTPNLEDQVPKYMFPSARWPNYNPRHVLPFTSLLRLAKLLWRYSNLPPHGDHNENSIFNILYNSCRGQAVFMRIMGRYCDCPMLQGTSEVVQISRREIRNISFASVSSVTFDIFSIPNKQHNWTIRWRWKLLIETLHLLSW